MYVKFSSAPSTVSHSPPQRTGAVDILIDLMIVVSSDFKLTSMPLTLKECNDFGTFSSIVDCEWKGYYNPYHTFMQVLFPVFGATTEARAAAIQESKERQWQWHTGDPTSHWLYVEDSETSQVIGGAQWHVHETNPWAERRPKLEAYWWPEGECKKFVEEMLEQVYGPRMVKMRRPHTCECVCYI